MTPKSKSGVPVFKIHIIASNMTYHVFTILYEHGTILITKYLYTISMIHSSIRMLDRRVAHSHMSTALISQKRPVQEVSPVKNKFWKLHGMRNAGPIQIVKILMRPSQSAMMRFGTMFVRWRSKSLPCSRENNGVCQKTCLIW